MPQTSSDLQQINVDDTADKLKAHSKLPQRWAAFAKLFSSNWLLCALLFCIAMGFNLYRLGVPGIWFDEAFSVELARQPFPLFWQIIFGLEPNMELYYLFLHGWLGLTTLFGLHPTEAVVRFPSAIFSASSTVVVFLLGRRFLGLLASLIGAVLYLLNDLQLVFAQQARSYSLQLLLICLAWYALLAALTGSSHQKRWWICFIIATTLAIYAHLFSLIIVFAQLCAFGALFFLPAPWHEKVKRQVFSLLISLIIIGLLIIPLLLVSLQGPKTGWLPIPHSREVFNLFLAISGYSKMYLLMLAAACLISLVAAIGSYLSESARAGSWGHKRFPSFYPLFTRCENLRQYLPIGLALLCWLVVPVAVSYLVSQGSVRFFSIRYLVTIVPPLLLLVGMGLSSLRWQTLKLILALVICAVALYAVPYYYGSAQVEDWNSTSFWVEQHYQAGDGLVCYDNAVQQGCQISVEYYFHAYPSAAHFTKDTPGAFSWTTFSSMNPDAAVDPTVLAAYATKHPHIIFIVGRLPDNMSVARAHQAQNWLDTHYHLTDQIVTRTVTVRIYATTATTATNSPA